MEFSVQNVGNLGSNPSDPTNHKSNNKQFSGVFFWIKTLTKFDGVFGSSETCVESASETLSLGFLLFGGR
jgi:hypothetical protein